MKILGIVSSFYPDIIEFEQNINSYLSGLDHLIIWENTPADKSQLNSLVKKLNNPKIEIRTNNENMFLAYPFNICINWAEANGFTHVLTLDQDSYFNAGDFDLFLNQITHEQSNDIAIFTPAINSNINLSDKVEKLKFAFTSGSVHPIGIFKKAGYFREDFLIYAIDVEFSFRVRRNGFSIVCYPNIILNHKMGYAKKNKLGLLINNYPALSTYYIIRNTIIMWREYPEEFSTKDRISFIKYKIIYRLLKIGFESKSLLKSKAVIIGLYHGILNKSGRYDL